MKRSSLLFTGLVVLASTLAALQWSEPDEAHFDDEEAAAPASTAVLAPVLPPATPTWTAETIRDLHPVPPPNDDAVSRPIPSLPDYDAVLLRLGRVVEAYDGDPDNAWAIAHGILARGLDFRLTNQLGAVAHLFSVYAEPRQVGAYALVGFPATRKGVAVEPHTDLLLKNLSEVGLVPDTPFPMADSQVTGADLYRYTLLKTFLRPAENASSFTGLDDMPWGVQALAAWAPSRDLRWVANDGTAMDLNTLTDFMVLVLTKESKFMFDSMRSGARFERKGQPLFGYTCGGAHLLQGTAYAVARGFGKAENRTYVAAQGPLLLYRLPIELSIYDAAMASRSKFKEKLLVQRLKFLGHWLESMSRMQILGLFSPDDMELHTIEGAAQNLVLTVNSLSDLGTFDRLDTLKESDHQLYLDVLGDSAHAVRGLELALGRQTLRW